MKPRKRDPMLARILLETHAKLEARYLELMVTAAPKLAAATSEAEARTIMEEIVGQLVVKLDAEAVKLGLPHDYFKQPRTLH